MTNKFGIDRTTGKLTGYGLGYYWPTQAKMDEAIKQDNGDTGTRARVRTNICRPN